jgi:hypothetical protein
MFSKTLIPGRQYYQIILFVITGPNIIKLFTTAVDECSNDVAFIHSGPFQPSLMFVGKARSVPYSVAHEQCFT